MRYLDGLHTSYFYQGKESAITAAHEIIHFEKEFWQSRVGGAEELEVF